MRNIRLDSLPTDRPTAPRGCALCTRRRIKCDRSTPSCVKCTSRNFVCPGFNLTNLKWDQGVASRGKFTGSQIPVHRGKMPVLKESVRRPRAQAAQIQAFQSFHGPSQPERALVCATQDLPLVNQCSRFMLLNKLLDHFSVEVVPRLTWIELPGNLWPTALQTFAQSSRCLQLSLSCAAATHLFATRTSPMREQFPFDQLHNQLRELSLRSVNDRIARVVTQKPGELGEQSIYILLTEALASMVALCYSEVFVSTPSRWRLHLRGCQTVVDHLSLYRTKGSYRPIETFLINEVADLEALSDFSAHSLVSSPMVTSASFLAQSNTFWGFTGLIREITHAERMRQHRQKKHCVPAIDMSAWHARADESFCEIISNVGKILGSQENQENMRCFKDIVRAHYYATIVYSYQALAPEAINEEKTISKALIASLEVVFITEDEPMKAFWHNLFLPLLIAGTLCSTDGGLQAKIDQFFLMALSISGSWCNYTSLQFLRSYWRRPHTDAHMNWIQYARSGRTQEGTFIVF